MKKIGKNYYRDELLKLKEESMKKPIVFTGKYKHGESLKWVTFTTIRRFFPKVKTKTVCNHINFEKIKVVPFITLTKEEHNRKYYFCARIMEYNYWGEIRAGLELATDVYDIPIWIGDSNLHVTRTAYYNITDPEGNPYVY